MPDISTHSILDCVYNFNFYLPEVHEHCTAAHLPFPAFWLYFPWHSFIFVLDICSEKHFSPTSRNATFLSHIQNQPLEHWRQWLGWFCSGFREGLNSHKTILYPNLKYSSCVRVYFCQKLYWKVVTMQTSLIFSDQTSQTLQPINTSMQEGPAWFTSSRCLHSLVQIEEFFFYKYIIKNYFLK